MHELLKQRNVEHALIEGDNLDLAHPAPHVAYPDADLARRNLRSMWQNYLDLGYRRLIYTNTASVLESADLAGAMGDEPDVTAVLLRATDSSTRRRLSERAPGTASADDITHSIRTAKLLDDGAPTAVHRIDTDDVNPMQLAEQLLDLLDWQRP